ncbi:MAG TPA: alkaline phosphatase PafA, partial [Flavobacteriales bacterium]|nr:alkaline phosphatase PafA [Flavobacteriales bacterium]
MLRQVSTKAVLCLLLCFPFSAMSQTTPKPRLVVGIVVDQMRYDYLYRYEKKYGKGGLMRLLNQGYAVHNCHYNYMPTYTGPGHASIYTGCTPSTHGIIANDWFDRTTKNYVYCVQDTSFKTVGAAGRTGMKAPTRMLTTTIGDELRINTVKKSKVFGVALKDRSSILPGGHAANGAFWFDDATGTWISSTYYYKDGFPQWIKDVNAKTKELFLHHLDQKWNTLYDISTYTESIADDNPYEKPLPGERAPVFPHDLPAIMAAGGNYGLIKITPFGNTITKDFAKLIIENEDLGKDEVTDLLCISFSSTDIIGHNFGPSSVETEDCYLRLDKDLEDLLVFLDSKIGKGKYTVFLTADHGAVEIPAYLKEFHIAGGTINEQVIENDLDTLMEQLYGKEGAKERYISSFSNQQVFFNLDYLSTKKVSLENAKKTCSNYLLSLKEIATVYDEMDMVRENYEKMPEVLLQNGFNHKRSGHLLVNYQPGVIEFAERGTSHGSPYTYDTHVPLLFYGAGIKKGSTTTYTTITQIAPTICNLLHIPFTNGSNPY